MDYRTLLLKNDGAAQIELERLLTFVSPPKIYGDWTDKERYAAIPLAVRQAFESLVKNIYDPDFPPGITILGKPGVGKTCATYAMARVLLKKYWYADEKFSLEFTPQIVEHVEWVQTVRKLNQYGASPEERATATQELEGFSKFPGFLFVDDVGVAQMSDLVAEYFYSLVDSRLKNRRPTIFISNATPETLATSLDPRVSHRLMRWTRVVNYE